MGIAEDMGRKQRRISVSEFFEKNRHLLGYDNKAKAMLIIVKEAVDNGLDACEEAGILPEIYVGIKELGEEKFRITIRDNGPGIVKEQVPKIFGSLLYGSKFHRLKQSRGQQGLGISCAVLYSQLTTGSATSIRTSTGDGKTHNYQLRIDVGKNKPIVMETNVDENGEAWHGTEVSFVAEATYRENRQSVLEYIKQTAISNPYADVVFDSPNGRVEFKRGLDKLPPEPKEIMPHIAGVELGVLMRMLANTHARTILSFLTTEFSRLGRQSANEIMLKAGITREVNGRPVPDIKLRPGRVTDGQAGAIIEAVKNVKLLRPPTDCLSPLGTQLIESGLRKELNPEFVASVTRAPEVYRGWPFQIEVGLAFGGSVQEFNLLRFANRVPLLYQGGACAITRAVHETDWRRYCIEVNRGNIEEPLIAFVHISSVWVPFTSESKEAVANYDIIIREIRLALQEAARKLSVFLSGKRKKAMLSKKKSVFERYAGETAHALSVITDMPKEEIKRKILEIINEKWEELNGREAVEEEDQETGTGSNGSAPEEGESEHSVAGEESF
jgi:DNA topoisomerase-6 subunit B